MLMQIQFITTPQELQAVIDSAIQKAFTELPTNAANGSKKPEIIDTAELCKRLNISEPTVIRWRKKGKIPYLSIGAAIRYDYIKVIEAIDGKL